MTVAEPTASAAAPPAPDNRQRLLDAALRRHQYRQDALIEVLHTAQNLYGYLTPRLLIYLARQLRLPPSRVYGVATFYNFFSLEPPGRHVAVICEGTACYMHGAGAIAAAIRAATGVGPGETAPDNSLSVGTAHCLGSCGLAPVVVLDGAVVGKTTPEAVTRRVQALVAAEAGR